ATPGTHPCPRRIISHRSRQDGQPKAHRWIEAKEHTVIGFIVAGLIIGALARLIKPGKQNLGLLATLLLGLAGSVIGGVIASLLGTGDIFELNFLGFIVAVIAAVLLVGTAEAIVGRRRSVRR
ncbi:GlsB/YeaQ/YmgE family stress response membrane protein, partial [Pseudarthrobacter sp. NPDC092076]